MQNIGSIFRSPRTTMRAILDSGSRRGFMLLPLVMGLLMAPQAALSVLAFEGVLSDYRVAVWASAFVLSILSYWMYVYVYGAAYRMIASWIGGTGTNAEARLSLAWAQVPFFVVAAVYVPIQFIFKDDLYPQIDMTSITSLLASAEFSSSYYVINAVFLAASLPPYLWSLILLGEACGISTWKAFLVKVIALLLHIPIFFVAGILSFPLSLAFYILTS